MRLWTLHPRYLDRQGLLALWREGLLAQKVLLGETRGYHHHPQLIRFRAHPDPVAAIATYLEEVAREAQQRGYCFDQAKLAGRRTELLIDETEGQLRFEREWLMAKLARRAPALLPQLTSADSLAPHPIFHIVPGPRRGWEKG